jgi:hypothetical protein
MSLRGWLPGAFALFFMTLWVRPALAHKPSDSYLTLDVQGAHVDGRWDIALRDLDYAIGLDADDNGQITWGEVRAKKDAIVALAFSHLALDADGSPCSVEPGDLRIVEHSDGAYAVVRFGASCPLAPRIFGVDYELFFNEDPQHRGVTRIDDGGSTRTAIFSFGDRRQSFEKTAPERGRQFVSAVKSGIGHIASGIDHLLFLLALLLPSVLRRDPGEKAGWKPVGTFKLALVDVAKIVTSFTVAHSITLSLSALDVVRLPSRLVESGIAASVVFAALNNIVPMLEGERWAAAFMLGLLHGFGFSATLLDLGLPRQALVLTLFGFNVGVEIGQLAVVAVFLPIAFLLRGTTQYRRVALVGGSIVITLIASVWFVERAFALRIIS